jgi:hypothetical protein
MTREEMMRKRLEFHQKLQERIFSGDPADSERWIREMEAEMEALMRDSESGIDNLRSESEAMKLFGSRARSAVSMQWEENQIGRVLKVKPNSPEIKMDVQVHQGMIHIKTEQVSSQGRAASSQSQNVPFDCDGDRVTTEGKGDELVLTFPWKAPPKASDNERKPLKKGAVGVGI